MKTNDSSKDIEVKRGEIYWCDLGKGFRCEQGNTRPVLIIQNNVGNRFSPTTIVAPITSMDNNKKSIPTHVNIDEENAKSFGLHKSSIVLLEQIKAIDKNRLGSYIGKLNDDIMFEVNKALTISLNI